MNKMNQVTNTMKVIDTSASMTIVVEYLEFEADSMEIKTVDHDDPSRVLRVIKKAYKGRVDWLNWQVVIHNFFLNNI